jgi:hypothetical protein
MQPYIGYYYLRRKWFFFLHIGYYYLRRKWLYTGKLFDCLQANCLGVGCSQVAAFICTKSLFTLGKIYIGVCLQPGRYRIWEIMWRYPLSFVPRVLSKKNRKKNRVQQLKREDNLCQLCRDPYRAAPDRRTRCGPSPRPFFYFKKIKKRKTSSLLGTKT